MRMKKKTFTKKAMVSLGWRVTQTDLDLVRKAASLQEISQSEFVRLAIRERATRILSEPARKSA
jgi:uncharacterized protein (DUF1778 family)